METKESFNPKPVIDYSVLTKISYVIDPYAVLKLVKSIASKTLCPKCKVYHRVIFGKYYVQFSCKCGRGFLYPPRKDRGENWLYKWISKREHDGRGH